MTAYPENRGQEVLGSATAMPICPACFGEA